MRVKTVWVEGREWRTYSAEFDSADGKFMFDFMAISDEHAAALLEELKATARLVGEKTDTFPVE